MKYDAGKYDIAVIGAGHAGCEAALATARMGLKTLLFSTTLEAVANMPCNPHIGGSSKGHLVRELDCLGGEMGTMPHRKRCVRGRDGQEYRQIFYTNKNVKYIKRTSCVFFKGTGGQKKISSRNETYIGKTRESIS